MGVRLLHTADWQIGMTRRFLEPEAQARFTAARADAVRRLGGVARDQDRPLRGWRDDKRGALGVDEHRAVVTVAVGDHRAFLQLHLQRGRQLPGHRGGADPGV